MQKATSACTSTGWGASGRGASPGRLWWGHRLPVWYRDEETYVGSAPDGGRLDREGDVLDTWFSSALWPFVDPGVA